MKIRRAHEAFTINLECVTSQEELGRRHLQTLLWGCLPHPFPLHMREKQQIPSIS